MKRTTLALVGILSVVTAGGLLAQTAAPAKSSAQSVAAQPATPAQPPKAAASKSMAPKWTSDQIKEVQAALEKAGYFKGKETGKFGKKTAAALRAWQKANKLPVTGKLTEDEYTKLKA